MSEHTPGPWGILNQCSGWAIISNTEDRLRGYVHVTTVLKPYAEKNRKRKLSDAHLIAAAPDLQKALLRLAMYCSGRLPTKEDLDGAEMKGAAAALAKARGEPAP